jgi:hypothetical protein
MDAQSIAPNCMSFPSRGVIAVFQMIRCEIGAATTMDARRIALLILLLAFIIGLGIYGIMPSRS